MRCLLCTSSQPATAGDIDLPAISRPMWRWFAWYARRFLRKHFHAVRVSKAGLPPEVEADMPMVVYANHPSWWDPMVAIFIAHELWPQRQHHFPIDAAMLRKYPFFRRLGFFGVNGAQRQGARDLLRTACSLLEDNATCLWLTPQGEFADVRKRPLCLKPGLAHLARRVQRAAIVPVAIEYAFWSERTPEALLRFEQPIMADRSRHNAEEWQLTFTSRLQGAMDALAQEVIRRDPLLFHPLLGGSTGTSRFYDVIRRVRALFAGQRFDPSHLPEQP